MNAFQIIGLIASGVLLLSIILLSFNRKKTDLYALICIVIGVLMEIIGIIGNAIVDSDSLKEPTALDVYRGKTTLEITYRDSVAIDSTVVYKVR